MLYLVFVPQLHRSSVLGKTSQWSVSGVNVSVPSSIRRARAPAADTDPWGSGKDDDDDDDGGEKRVKRRGDSCI